MLTAPTAIREAKSGNFKSLQSRVAANSAGAILYRADYELRQLRRVQVVTKRLFKLLMHARTAEAVVQFSRELDRWIERERILLRIPLPRSDSSPKQAHSPMLEATPTVAPTAPNVPSLGQ